MHSILEKIQVLLLKFYHRKKNFSMIFNFFQNAPVYQMYMSCACVHAPVKQSPI